MTAPATSSRRDDMPRRGCRVVRRILFVELLGGIGDLLLALPSVHALARSHPGAQVTVLTFAPGSELVARDPLVSEVVVAQPGPPQRQRETVADLVARGFDLVVSDTRYGDIPRLLHDSATPWVIDDLWRRPPPDQRIDLRFLELLAADGAIDPALRTLEPAVALTESERRAGAEAVARLLPPPASEAPTSPAPPSGLPAPVLLLPDAGMPIKEWAPHRFRALASHLTRRGCPVLVAQTPEPTLARDLVAGLEGAAVLPRSSLREFAAAAAACAAVVAGDTGPARVAAAVGTPVVGLYGPTWAGRFGLRERHASLQSPLPCHIRNPADMTTQSCWYSGVCVFDDHRTCTDDLTVDIVERALGDLHVTRRVSPPPVPAV